MAPNKIKKFHDKSNIYFTSLSERASSVMIKTSE